MTLTDLPVGWDIIDSEDINGVPCVEITIQCANKEIAERSINNILINEKIINNMTMEELLMLRKRELK